MREGGSRRTAVPAKPLTPKRTSRQKWRPNGGNKIGTPYCVIPRTLSSTHIVPRRLNIHTQAHTDQGQVPKPICPPYSFVTSSLLLSLHLMVICAWPLKQQAEAELAECTFQPNASLRTAATRSRTPSPAPPAVPFDYAPSRRVLQLLNAPRTPSASTSTPNPGSRRGPTREWLNLGRHTGSASRLFNDTAASASRSFAALPTAWDAGSRLLASSARPVASPMPQGSLSGQENDGSPGFDIDTCMQDFNKCLDAFLAVASPVPRPPAQGVARRRTDRGSGDGRRSR